LFPALPLKFIAAPLSAASVFLGDILTDFGGYVGIALNIAALGILVGGFVVVGYYRSSVDAKNEIIKDLKDERDIDRQKTERLGGEVRDLLIKCKSIEGELEIARLRVMQLEERPDTTLLLADAQSGRQAAVAEISAKIDVLVAKFDSLAQYVLPVQVTHKEE
jgi:hypothetical protein